jgi:hypothetical protein
MTKRGLVAALVAAGAGIAAPAAAQDQGASGAIAARILGVHNRERAAVGHPPMQWDPALAAAAASYGPQLARLGRLVHSPRESRPGQRENLAMAYRGTHSPEQLLDMWVVEKHLLRPGLFPEVSRTGRWKDVAHYTQMVWKTTTRVGCAIHRAQWDYLICRYSPPGNVDGKPVFDAATTLAAR